MTATITDMVMRLVAAGAGPIEAASVVAEAHALGASSVTALPVTLSATLPLALPPQRSRKAINQARYRENVKAKQGAGVAMAAASSPATEAVTQPVTSGNAVTSAPLSILPLLADSQVIQEEKKAVLNTEPRAKAKRRRRGEGDGNTRMTEDWSPDAKGMQKATDRGLRLVEIEIEITKFRNYWINRTDRDSWKPRWDLAWENWLLNAKGTLNAGANGYRANPNPGPPQTHGDAVMAGMARYAARRREGQPAAARDGLCGRDDVAAEPDADGRSARGDREPSRQLALVPPADTGK